MIRHLVIIGLVLGLATVAHAQPLVDLSNVTPQGAGGSLSVSSFDPTDATAPISVVEGRGVKVGEGTVLHPAFGISTGFDSNVFTDSQDVQAAAVLRLIGQVTTGSLPYQRLHPGQDPMAGGQGDAKPERGDQNEGDFQYRASARVAYDQLISGNSTVNQTGGLGVGVLLHAVVDPNGTFAFSVDDDFDRAIRAASFETSENENRDLNTLRLAMLYQPHDHSVSGYLYYYNLLDIIENSFNTYPDRMFNRIGVHPMWLVFPQTKLYADVSVTNITGIGDNAASQAKSTSDPLDARVGIQTLLNLRTMVNAAVGYTNGFYSTGPSYSGVDGNVLVSFRYSPLGRVGLGYDLQYQDSINANFYREHVIRGFLQQDFAPVLFMVAPELHFRQYDGLNVPGNSAVRNDTIFAVVAGLHYAYRDWIGVVLDYRFSTVSTDFRYNSATSTMPIDPSYTRHELLLGLRVAM